MAIAMKTLPITAPQLYNKIVRTRYNVTRSLNATFVTGSAFLQLSFIVAAIFESADLFLLSLPTGMVVGKLAYILSFAINRITNKLKFDADYALLFKLNGRQEIPNCNRAAKVLHRLNDLSILETLTDNCHVNTLAALAFHRRFEASDFNFMRLALAKKTTDPKVLLKLSSNDPYDVREAVASNSHTPDLVLNGYLYDEWEVTEVREAAANNPSADPYDVDVYRRSSS